MAIKRAVFILNDEGNIIKQPKFEIPITPTTPKQHVIEITYSGDYPNYCSGLFTIKIDDKSYKTDDGRTWYEYLPKEVYGWTGFDENYSETYGYVQIGTREVTDDMRKFKDWLAKNRFPENLFDVVMRKISDEYGKGCCGGCI